MIRRIKYDGHVPKFSKGREALGDGGEIQVGFVANVLDPTTACKSHALNPNFGKGMKKGKKDFN